jgi:hypothetical protein
MIDPELDRLWERIAELWIRREKQKGRDSRSEYTFATDRARHKSGRNDDKEKVALRSRLKKAIASLEEEVNLPVVYAPSLDSASTVDVTEDARVAFNGKATPMGNVWPLVNNPKVKWGSNSKDWTKADVFASLSEIVYLQIGKYELKGKDRYEIIPSEVLRLLLETDIRLDFARVFPTGDVGITTSDTNNCLFASFIFPQFTVVAIRGTAPILQDIVIDLKAMMLLVDGEGYHRGFYNEAQRALLPLRDTVKETKNPIYFTGHSLGGALSGLLAKMWPGPEKSMIPYTFGCPRFGNQRTVRSHSVYSFVRKFDPVPYLPPSIVGYRPAGWPPTLVPSEDELPRGLSFRKLTVSAHRIGGYRALIGKHVKTKQFAPEIYYEALKARLLSK